MKNCFSDLFDGLTNEKKTKFQLNYQRLTRKKNRNIVYFPLKNMNLGSFCKISKTNVFLNKFLVSTV